MRASERSRAPALSPSRASDFKQCPLLYRFRAVDKIPETPSQAQVRGTVVHTVLERLFTLPAGQRDLATAKELVQPVWRQLRSENPAWEPVLDSEEAPTEAGWIASVAALVESYFALEDPSTLDPEACELYVEAELDSGVALRGYVDRLDVAPAGEIRVVDYKSGTAPREVGEAKALFQMKFYAVVLWRMRGVVPRQLKLLYLADGETLAYTPDEEELRRFERTIDAIAEAILRAGETGDFRPNPSKLCGWCNHQAICPTYGGSPPAYPGWPGNTAAGESVPSRQE